MTLDHLHSVKSQSATASSSKDESSDDPLRQMAGLMSRLLDDPESEAVLVPQLLKLSEDLPEGPARGVLESSVATVTRLRSWLGQLQSRQRLATRFADVTARLSRVEGLPGLMQALADEARLMLDAPLSRLEVFAPLVTVAAEHTLVSHSGSFLSRLPQVRWNLQRGLCAQAMGSAVPVLLTDGLSETQRTDDPEWAAQFRAEGVHGLIIVPLMLEGQCCGLLTVADRMVRPWSTMDLDALQQMGVIAVRAVGRAARADMAQHTLQALHERQRAMRLQLDRDGSGSRSLIDAGDRMEGADPEPGNLSLLIEGVSPGLREAYVDGLIGALRRADQNRGTALVTTLLTYMDHGHNARAAARVLGVHVNTLHNRLETINSLLPGWNTPGRSLEVHLALRLSPPSAKAQRLSN